MQSLLTAIFLFIRIVSNPIANLFQKKLTSEISSVTINLYSYLILSFACLPFIPKYINIEMFSVQFVLWILFAGFLCALGTVCTIKAVNIGELSILGPINSYKSIIGLITALFLLKEIPSFLAVIGIILIILGSKFISETTNEGFSFSFFKRKDIQLRIYALILTGIEAAILKKIIILSNVEACFIFWCFTGLLWTFIFTLISKKQIKVKSLKNIYILFVIALCLGLMQYSTNFVFSRLNVGYALALFQLSSIITVFFGYKFFKEQNIMNKLIGTTIMIIGSTLIILF